MRITFNLCTMIEVLNVDVFSNRDEIEKEFVEFFTSAGIIVHGLVVTNYNVSTKDNDLKIVQRLNNGDLH